MLRITLKRSVIKCTREQRETVRGLGLRRIRQTRVLQDTPAIRGMVSKVIHMVDVEEVAD